MNEFDVLFKDIEKISELKKIYRNLIMKLHPDVAGGSLEKTQALNASYEKYFNIIKDRELLKDYSERIETININEKSKDFIEVIDYLMQFNNIIIELVGNWVWLSGETKPIKDDLKEHKFFWSSGQKKWYWNGASRKKSTSSRKKFDDIASKYGYKKIETGNLKKLEAYN